VTIPRPAAALEKLVASVASPSVCASGAALAPKCAGTTLAMRKSGPQSVRVPSAPCAAVQSGGLLGSVAAPSSSVALASGVLVEKPLVLRRPSVHASQILECDFISDLVGACTEKVDDVLRRLFGLAIFKIGITANPNHRFTNELYGYSRVGELYSDMAVLARGEPDLMVELEQRLIGVYERRLGCRNVAMGGESAPRDYPAYVYCVWRFVGDGRPTTSHPADAELSGFLAEWREKFGSEALLM